MKKLAMLGCALLVLAHSVKDRIAANSYAGNHPFPRPQTISLPKICPQVEQLSPYRTLYSPGCCVPKLVCTQHEWTARRFLHILHIATSLNVGAVQDIGALDLRFDSVLAAGYRPPSEGRPLQETGWLVQEHCAPAGSPVHGCAVYLRGALQPPQSRSTCVRGSLHQNRF